MIPCPRCGKQNETEARFCTKCGLNFIEYRSKQIQPSEDTQFCYRHPKTATNLTCGRCDKPVCTDCVVLGPAGPRCPECAKTNTPFRPAAVTLNAKRAARSLTGRGPIPWYYILILFVIFGGVFRGCSSFFAPPQTVIIQTPEDGE